eukprot:9547187-Alexandrium_andersonii.AAC.1
MTLLSTLLRLQLPELIAKAIVEGESVRLERLHGKGQPPQVLRVFGPGPGKLAVDHVHQGGRASHDRAI